MAPREPDHHDIPKWQREALAQMDFRDLDEMSDEELNDILEEHQRVRQYEEKQRRGRKFREAQEPEYKHPFTFTRTEYQKPERPKTLAERITDAKKVKVTVGSPPYTQKKGRKS